MQQRFIAMYSNVLITGIPRSGTSYLCTLLHNVENCVAINEPDEDIFPHLSQPKVPLGLSQYYDNLRVNILAGVPVANKLLEGKLIEDTADINHEELYTPHVSSPNFLLATKNTLMYLGRLLQIRQDMPDATIVACVRHPFDSIASWKGTFGHLGGATVEGFRIGHSGDRALSVQAQGRLLDIAVTASQERRRALLWRHLASLILESRDVLHLLRYEDLVADPQMHISTLLKRIPYSPDFRPVQPFSPSSVSHKRSANLNIQDIQAIREICSETASAFGYDLSKTYSLKYA